MKFLPSIKECEAKCPEGWTFDESVPECTPPSACALKPCPGEATCEESYNEAWDYKTGFLLIL